MENHLERSHPSALGLNVSAPYCPACDERFASKRLLIDHIMDAHVLARISPSPARAVGARARSVAPSPARDAATDQGGCADIVNQDGITSNDTFTMMTSDFQTSPIPYLNVPTNFSYQQPADKTAYTHPIAQRVLPPTPMAIDLQANIQGNADQRHDSDQPGEPEHC